MGNSTSDIPDAPPYEEIKNVYVPSPLPEKKPVEVLEETKEPSVILCNDTKRSITYWIGDEAFILGAGETSDMLPPPVYVYPSKVLFRPPNTPRLYLISDSLMCAGIDYISETSGSFHSITGSATFTAEHKSDHYEVHIRPIVSL